MIGFDGHSLRRYVTIAVSLFTSHQSLDTLFLKEDILFFAHFATRNMELEVISDLVLRFEADSEPGAEFSCTGISLVFFHQYFGSVIQ